MNPLKVDEVTLCTDIAGVVAAITASDLSAVVSAKEEPCMESESASHHAPG